jgi:hypothetical protein
MVTGRNSYNSKARARRWGVHSDSKGRNVLIGTDDPDMIANFGLPLSGWSTDRR